MRQGRHGLTARRWPPILDPMTADRAPRDWTAADLRTIGYFAKAPSRRPEWLRAPQVEWVCSVSDCSCAARSLEHWIEHWLHNGLFVFDTLAKLECVLTADEASSFVRYGLRTLPAEFDEAADGVASEQAIDFADVHPEPIPEQFVRLGFDLSNRSVGSNLECSPLSCNNRAAEIATNCWCLLDDFEVALRLAREWGSAGGIGVEPGPYMLLEVWADRLPDQPSR
jgi:hypothetical protein